MLRYEETKPLEKQALAAVKKRARMKFRWGSSSGSSSNNNSTSHSVPSSSTSKISSSKVTKESTVRAHSSPEFASSLATTSAKTSVGSSKRPSYRLRLRPRQLPSIIESELEDQEDSDDEDDGSNTSTVSTSSSASSSISLPATSAYAFESPESSLTSTATTTSSCSSLPESTHNDKVKELSEKTMAPFLPRVEYNLRKLLRQVMGLDGLWSYDQQVERHYARIHWTIKHTVADGNCLFRAISDQLYGHEMFHGDIRRRIVDFMQREGALFQPFLATTEATAETIEQYCRRMKREGEWGGNPELYAAAKLFNIHIIVHQGPMRRVRIENGCSAVDFMSSGDTTTVPPPYKILHLLYKDDHYSSLHPPSDATDDTNGGSTNNDSSTNQQVSSSSKPSEKENESEATQASHEKVLCPELRALPEEIPSVVVNKAARAVFHKGKRSSCVEKKTTMSPFTKSRPHSPSEASPPKASDASKEDPLGDAKVRIVFPKRLRFHRGVPHKMTSAAC